ncbi:MAG: hypothetical protein Q9167_002430 [Letrouitia subvulpina]
MSFQRFDSFPEPQEAQSNRQSKRPRLSLFQFTSYQSSRTPSNEPPAYTPDDHLATRAQFHVKLLKYMRIALAFLTLVISIAIIACSASALRAYSSTRDDVEFVLPLWPTSVDLRPTHVVLACGVILTVTSLAYLAAAFVSSSHNSLRRLNTLSTLVSFVGIFITVFTTAFASAINNHLASTTDAGTLGSWTCRWQDFESIAPKHFASICMESTVAMNLVILSIVLQALGVLLAGWGWLVEAKGKRGVAGKGEGGGM